MDNVHGDYLLKRFYEERDSIMGLAEQGSPQVRSLIARHLEEIEYQIGRAFADMEKESAKKEGGAP